MLKRTLDFTPTRRQTFQAKLGMYLFLAGVGFVFFSALIVYAVVRTAMLGPTAQTLRIPTSFWASTAAVVGISVALHQAVLAVHRQRLGAFRRWLLAAVGIGLLFFVGQIVGMAELLESHFAVSDGSMRVFGIAFSLAFLHAMHVVGGFGLLGWVVVRGCLGAYDHERHWPVDICATYWHFLDGVWIVMLLTFVVVR